MKLIKPSFEIYEQGPGLEGIYEAIERAGRTCYKSQAKYQYRNPHTGEVYEPDFKSTFATGDSKIGITTTAEDFYNKYGVFIKESTTAKGFVDRMIASQHYAMLEHGTVYLKVPFSPAINKYSENPYSKNKVYNMDSTCYITTNYRVLVENRWLDDLKYLCEPTEHHERRVTVRFTTDRGVSHEFVRHRVFSFAQESTRYCNYSKDKFGNELTFIAPSWLDEYYYDGNTYTQIFLDSLKAAESNYLDLLKKWEEKIPDARYKTGFRNNPWTPQQARQVLPNALKTELIMTGFVQDWQHFFDLRARGTTGAPHPDAKALAEPLMQEFIKRNLITE